AWSYCTIRRFQHWIRMPAELLQRTAIADHCASPKASWHGSQSSPDRFSPMYAHRSCFEGTRSAHPSFKSRLRSTIEIILPGCSCAAECDDNAAQSDELHRARIAEAAARTRAG